MWSKSQKLEIVSSELWNPDSEFSCWFDILINVDLFELYIILYSFIVYNLFMIVYYIGDYSKIVL